MDTILGQKKSIILFNDKGAISENEGYQAVKQSLSALVCRETIETLHCLNFINTENWS